MSRAPLLRRAALLAAASLTLAVAACGGGGGGGDSSSVLSSTFPPSASLANICTADGQKSWVRSYLDEVYLWYDEVQPADAGAYATVQAYFDALLVRTPDASGQPKDRFSTVMSSAAANVLQGITAASPPSAATAAADPVPLAKTLTSGAGRNVGYVLFNEHSQGAQDKLIAAFSTLKAAGVQDLVLDLRYNPGGFLYVAQAAAAMVAGPSVEGQVFERLSYSAKRHAQSEADTFYFSSKVQTAESTYAKGTPLPQLNLPRLYVLTSQLTCSASESIVNSLRGIGVQVVLVGDRTCGKPYGFHRKDNCDLAYFPIEFKVSNAAGFGDYTTGFPVQCRVAEDPAKPLGDATEPLLAAALTHIDTGACPAGTAAGVLIDTASPSPLQRAGAPSPNAPMYQPGWNGRRLLP